jgi:hypothetical protein
MNMKKNMIEWMMTDDEIGFLLMSTSFDLTTNFPLHAFKRYSTLPLKNLHVDVEREYRKVL